MRTSPLTITRLTPPGRGGVGVLFLTGAGAFAALTPFFAPPSGKHFSPDMEIGPLRNRPLFGWFYLDLKNEVHEEVVVRLVSKEKIEIHCHGGDWVVAAIIRRLVGVGATEIVEKRPEWNDEIEKDKSDPDFYRDALRLLPYARTERTAKIILDQMNGEPERFVAAVRKSNGEDLKMIARLDRILAQATLGRRLMIPPRVILTGPVNAGKSSLLNALVGFERVIADPSEGTTRDAVLVETILDGFPVTLCDTAGIREGESEIEREGISRATALLKDADLVLTVFDVTAPERNPPEEFFARLDSLDVKIPLNHLSILNKIDLPANRHNPFWKRFLKETDKNHFVMTGIPSPETIDALQSRIVAALYPFPPEKGEIVPLNVRQVSFFRRLKRALEMRPSRD